MSLSGTFCYGLASGGSRAVPSGQAPRGPCPQLVIGHFGHHATNPPVHGFTNSLLSLASTSCHLLPACCRLHFTETDKTGNVAQAEGELAHSGGELDLTGTNL